MRKKIIRALALGLSIIFTIQPVYAYAANYADTINNSVKRMAENKTFSGTGEGTVSNPYKITNAQQLDEIRYNLSACYFLENDIDISNIKNWSAIGLNDGEDFDGALDGNGHTIEGLTYENYELRNDSECIGLFYSLGNRGIIKNLTIDANIDLHRYSTNSHLAVGTFVASGDGIISNCSAKGKISIVLEDVRSSSSPFISGLGGADTIENCVNNVNITINGKTDNVYVGGITAGGASKIRSCINYGNIFASVDASYGAKISCGGISGTTSTIIGCKNYGHLDVTTTDYVKVGGISGEGGDIQYCMNYGKVSGSVIGYYSFGTYPNLCVGGILGAGQDLDIIGCYNDGIVEGYAGAKGISSSLGGIAGFLFTHYYSSDIIDCINSKNTIYKYNTSLNKIPTGNIGIINGNNVSYNSNYYLESLLLSESGNYVISTKNNAYSIGNNQLEIALRCIANTVNFPKWYLQDENALITDISLDQTSVIVGLGESKNISVNLKPTDADISRVIWLSNNPEIAVASNGTVTGKSIGETTIWAITENGLQAACDVFIVDLSDITSVTKIQGKTQKYYGVKKYKNTPEGDIYDDSIAFVKAMDNYLSELKKATQKDIQTINKNSKSSAELLREADKVTNDKIITMDARIPDAAMNSVYETLAQYLDTYVETGVSLGKIDMSASTIEISTRIVNKIRNNLDSLDFTRKIGRYTVTFKILKFMGAYTGSVTVQGNGRYYTGIIVSSSEETAKVLTTYMNDMSQWVKDALYESLKSIFTELANITGISDYTKKEINELLKDKVKLLQDKGYGNLLKYWQAMRDGYDICQKIVTAKDATNLTDALNNVESIYNKIKKLNYSDETVSNKIVATAMNKLNSAKNKLAHSLYYYIYDTNNENEGNNDWWTNTWNSFKSIFVQCPVDFVVYDNNGNELGKVEDTETTCTSDIHISIDGDVKTIVIPFGIDARIEFTGTDTGNMTYIVEQTVDGEVIGRTNFYNIPLSDGCIYSQDISGESLTEGNSITLNSKDQIYKPSQYISSDNTEANIGVLCETDKGGLVVGTGIYAKGDPVVLTAYPENDSYKFEGWYINNSLVEIDNVYRFAALNDVTIQAVFKPIREMDNAYIVTMSKDYEELADIHIYKSSNNLNDIVISMAGISDTEELKVLLKRYIQNYNSVDDIEIETKYDGICRFDMPSIDLTGFSKVEVYNEQEELIGTIKSINAGDENQENATPTPSSNTPIPSPDNMIESTQIPFVTPTKKPDNQPTETPKPTATVKPIVTSKPTMQPTVKPTVQPTVKPTVQPTVKPTVQPTNKPSSSMQTDSSKLSSGKKIKVSSAWYNITSTGRKTTVEYMKSTKKNAKTITIPAKVKYNGVSYKVTAIAKNAFKNNMKLQTVTIGKYVTKIGNSAFRNCKKLTMLTIGKNVKKIGAKAFYKCRKLQYIMVESKKLKLKNVGGKAFEGGYRSPRLKSDKTKWKAYVKIFLKRGLSPKTVFIIDPVKLKM